MAENPKCKACGKEMQDEGNGMWSCECGVIYDEKKKEYWR